MPKPMTQVQLQGSSFVGGGDEPEQQLRAGVVQRGESQFVDQDHVVAEQGGDDPADAVVGQPAVQGIDEVGGGEVFDLCPAWTAAIPRATRTWDLPVPEVIWGLAVSALYGCLSSCSGNTVVPSAGKRQTPLADLEARLLG